MVEVKLVHLLEKAESLHGEVDLLLGREPGVWVVLGTDYPVLLGGLVYVMSLHVEILLIVLGVPQVLVLSENIFEGVR